ncbi:MAG: hypothetical protein CMI27_02445 [Opitutae bacterium]|nr:hypothetical protein [Opitutae bacterium]|tara:strand:- start:8845 stop:9732 length:888 start_codon:yes stop_codon:yes gene_type:complete
MGESSIESPLDDVRSPLLKDLHPKVPLLSAPFAIQKNLSKHRYLLGNMVKRNLNQRYDKALLGYLWTLLEPALLALVYYVLFVIIADYEDQSYPMLILLGVIGWGLFARILNSTVSTLVSNAGMIKQSGFPLELYSASDSRTNLVISAISLLTVIPFMVYLNLQPSSHLWMLPVAMFMLYLSAWGVGLMVASANVVFPDVAHVFRFITRAGFFVSPIMWTYELLIERAGADSPYVDIAMLNPVVVPLTMMKHSVLGTIPDFATHHIVYAVAFPVVVYILGSMIFSATSRGVVKRL